MSGMSESECDETDEDVAHVHGDSLSLSSPPRPRPIPPPTSPSSGEEDDICQRFEPKTVDLWSKLEKAPEQRVDTCNCVTSIYYDRVESPMTATAAQYQWVSAGIVLSASPPTMPSTCAYAEFARADLPIACSDAGRNSDITLVPSEGHYASQRGYPHCAVWFVKVCAATVSAITAIDNVRAEASEAHVT